MINLEKTRRQSEAITLQIRVQDNAIYELRTKNEAITQNLERLKFECGELRDQMMRERNDHYERVNRSQTLLADELHDVLDQIGALEQATDRKKLEIRKQEEILDLESRKLIEARRHLEKIKEKKMQIDKRLSTEQEQTLLNESVDLIVMRGCDVRS